MPHSFRQPASMFIAAQDSHPTEYFDYLSKAVIYEAIPKKIHAGISEGKLTVRIKAGPIWT